ncbi:MAG: rod shape-determining protein MreC [Planctomycetota bacterium]|jgi:rod shape-determining protein MreC
MKKTDADSAWLIFIVFSVLLLLTPHDFVNHWRLSFFSFCSSSRESIAAYFTKPTVNLESKRGGNDLEEKLFDAERQVREYRGRLLKTQAKLAQARRSLADIAELKEYLPKVKFINAGIIFRNYRHMVENDLFAGAEIYIDKGFSSGLKVTDAALQGQAVIGIVNKVYTNSAVIRLLSHPEIIIPGRLQNSLKECYIHGQDNGQVIAVFFGNKPESAIGNLIFTSGLLGNFPQNLLIGEIKSAPALSKDKRTYFCSVNPSADLNALDHILIVKRGENK